MVFPQKRTFTIGLIALASIAYTNWPVAWRAPVVLEKVDVTALFSMPEAERLRYFREINLTETLQNLGLNGGGQRVTIMGEEVDATHPDLGANVVNQYNSFVVRGQVLRGESNQPYGAALLGSGDGHGTHIAGTIAAQCDGVGIQGVACAASLDVYDLGFYDSASQQPSDGWGNGPVETRFLEVFTTAMLDVIARGESRIINGSFNLEAPAILTIPGGPLTGWSLEKIISDAEREGYEINSVASILDGGLAMLQAPEDRSYMERLAQKLEDPDMLALSLLITKTREWAELEGALAAYQAADGAYIITESNDLMDNRTSVLNALPSLSDKVDEDLWISVVMVARPLGENAMPTGDYFSPINTCGALAANYCIITPSYSVFSTMTERVAFQDSGALFNLDGRHYQMLDGHSMGAPMVAGALALMAQYSEENELGYTMRDIVTILKEAANRSFPGYDPALHGRGMLDIGTALKMMGADLNATSDFSLKLP